jgi:malonyl-CoA/methylmalonyl-CoA synthetase
VTNLDALADVWEWSERDTLVHGLPLFHVHGLVLGTIGQLRLGGTLHHVGRFAPERVCAAVAAGGTLVFGVPTMYRRLADLAEADAGARDALAAARLLVSGSAALSRADEERIARVTGRRIVQRYGLSETIMNTAAPAAAGSRPGSVGPALPGVTIELLDDGLEPIAGGDGETLGQVAVRGPNLFSGYLNRPDATAAAFHGGAFLTGDVATRDADGWLRIAGRMSTDLIKTGGYKVGAGEVEAALSEHPDVDDVAVVGVEDPDLGERIEAFVVLRRPGATEEELTGFVGELIASHKRPRRIRFVDDLPRNAMGKIVKKSLREAAERDA